MKKILNAIYEGLYRFRVIVGDINRNVDFELPSNIDADTDYVLRRTNNNVRFVRPEIPETIFIREPNMGEVWSIQILSNGSLTTFILQIVEDFIARVNADGGEYLPNGAASIAAIDLDPNIIGLITPSAIKVGKLYALLPDDGSSDLTVTRNSEGTYIDKNGDIQTAAIDVPRVDYFEGKPVLLVERESTNIVSNPTTLSDWTEVSGGTKETVANGVKVAKPTTDPDARIQVSTSINSLSDYFTCSIYLDANDFTSEYAHFFLFTTGVTTNLNRISVNLNNLSIFSYPIGNETVISSVRKYGSTLKIELTMGNVTGNNTAQLRIYPCTEQNNTATDDTGYIVVKGVQLEEGNGATSLILNGGSTRPADVMTYPVPTGVTEIREYLYDGSINIENTIPTTYQVPVGKYDKIEMR